ncbi:TolC family outer membrane protein [Rhodobacterales bacterium HKCCE2091]|nr:TolC family outer membrane protein [Rhodobacterales bacterium HKCCE2091]
MGGIGRLALVCAALLLGPAAEAYTLRDALAAAYRNSDLLEQNRYLLRLQDESVAQQIAGLRPIVSFSAASSYSPTSNSTVNSLNLVAEMLVYDGGGTALLVQAARENVLAARQGLVNVEQQVLLNAVTAYVNVWSSIQSVQVRESNVRVVTEQLRAARDRFEVGEDTRTDVAQAEAALAAARSQLAAARGQLEIAEELFIIAVGERPGGPGGPGALPDLPYEETRADAIARNNHPAILGLQHEVRSNELALASARTDYGPTVSVQAQAGRSYGGNNPGYGTTFSLNLSQPIYRGGQLFSLERVAIATLSASQAELNQQVRTVIQAVGNAYAQLRIANAQIQASDQQIRAAQLALDGVREEASLGARTTLDVLDAQQDLLDAQISRITAQADLYIAGYTALSAMGLLTVDNLDLPVPEYDPAAYSNAYSNAPARVTSEQGARLDAVLDRLGRN